MLSDAQKQARLEAAIAECFERNRGFFEAMVAGDHRADAEKAVSLTPEQFAMWRTELSRRGLSFPFTDEELATAILRLGDIVDVDVEGHRRWLETGEGEPFPPLKR
jgi:hypothetical protein